MASTEDLGSQLDEKCKVTNGVSSDESPATTPTNDPMSKNGDQAQADFKLESLCAYFESCITPEGHISVDSYILGYDELYKFLNLLGTVFGWVASDVHAKLEILREHRKNDEIGKHFVTIESMTSYEVEENLIKTKAKDCSTGSRNLLRLHRALEYIIAFLDSIQDLELTEKLCGVSQESYKKTLQKFHPWVVQKAALLAMHMLPTKQGLLQKISAESEAEQKKAKETLSLAVAAMKDVYDRTNAIYKEKNLLDLP